MKSKAFVNSIGAVGVGLSIFWGDRVTFRYFEQDVFSRFYTCKMWFLYESELI